jgi:hypothetical protein
MCTGGVYNHIRAAGVLEKENPGKRERELNIVSVIIKLLSTCPSD